MRTLKKYWPLLLAALAAIFFFKKSKANGSTLSDILSPVGGNSATGQAPVDYKNMSMQEKQNLWLKVIAQSGVGDNNTSDYGYQLMSLFGMVPHNNEVLNQAVLLFPDVAAASGFDNKYKVLNPKLQSAGANFTLQRINKTGIAGVAKGVFSLAQLIPGVGDAASTISGLFDKKPA